VNVLKLLSFCFLPLFATAQVAIPVTSLPFSGNKAYIEPNVLIFKDHGGSITREQAWNLLVADSFETLNNFEKPGKFQFGQYNFWMAFVLENRSKDTIDLVVESWGRDAIWIKRDAGNFQEILTPGWFPFKDNLGAFPYKVRTINTFSAFPFERDTLFLMLHQYKPFSIFVPRLSEIEAYSYQHLDSVKYTNLFYLFFLGAASILMLFSAAQYFQQRDLVFLWYAFYLFSLVFVAWRNVEDTNQEFQLTYYFLPWVWTKVFHTAAHFITYTLFIYYFLKIDNEFPVFMATIRRFVIIVSITACIAEVPLLWNGLLYPSWLLYFSFRAAMTLFSFVFLFLLWRERSRLAHIILLGTLCAILGEFVSLFLSAPYSTFAGAIGVFLEIIFLTTGLAYRARLFRESHYRLQNEHIAQLEENERLREIAKKEEVEAFKNLFYANITHEFRTPLTVILGMAESLRERTDTQVQKAGKLITRNGRNLLDLVNQLLDLSKIESGKLALHPSRADVMQFIKVNAEAFESLAEMKKQRLSVITEPKELWTDFDPDRLQQIIANLVGNAVKFTPEGGMVGVSARFQEKTTLVIEVRDTGIGISEEVLPHVFKRFYQAAPSQPPPKGEGLGWVSADERNTNASNNTTWGEAGSGIGLAFADELVRLMGGRIEVESVVGKGSTFRVTLPIQAQEKDIQWAPEANSPATPHEVVPSSLVEESVETEPAPLSEDMQILSGKPLLLFVEDNADLVQYLTMLLSRDYQLLIAQNGLEGLEKAFDRLPDLVLSDVMMPGMDGLEFCKQLKNDPRTSHIPVVMLTARSAVEARIDGLQRGADAWLTKPFHRGELFATLAAMLESRKRLQVYFQQNTTLTALPPEAAIAPLIAKENEFLARIRNLLDARLNDARYDIEALCRDLAMSRMQLHRKLTALGASSAALFIRSHRLRHARQLLENTKFTISEIAYDSGFSDPAYFTRCFKEEFGKAPSEWKRG